MRETWRRDDIYININTRERERATRLRGLIPRRGEEQSQGNSDGHETDR